MKTRGVLLAAGVLLAGANAFADPSACDALANNLVTNCGFETRNFNGWTVSNLNNTFVADNGFDTGVHSGGFFAALGNVGSDGTIRQTLADVSGQSYTFSFFYAADGGQPHDFSASWDGTTLLALTDTPAQGYTEYSYTVTGTGSDTISFRERNDPSYDGLDDVSVTSARTAPEPSSFWMLFGLLGAGAWWKLRQQAA